METLSRRWPLVVIRGVFAVLFGVLALVWPGITVLALAVLWGVYALFDGAVAATLGITDRESPAGQRWVYFGLGVLGVVVGVLTLAWPGITVLALLLVIAVWAIMAGVLQIVQAIRLRKVIRNEWFLALTGVVALALGVLLLVHPAESAVVLVAAIGVGAIVWGVTLIVFGFRLRALGKTVTAQPKTAGQDAEGASPGPAV